ncbi:MAG: hypothetical protein QM765_33990 [Myxococcales bacterium]
MKSDPIIPWKQDPTEPPPAALVKNAGGAQPLSEDALARVWGRLSPKFAAPPTALPGPLKLVVAAVLSAAGIGAVFYALRPVAPPVPASSTAQAAPRVAASSEPSSPSPIPNPEPPAVAAPAPAKALPARPAVRHPSPEIPATALPVPPAPATPAEEPESALAAESRLLGRAVEELRVRSDAERSLSTLDEYAQRFPTGTLSNEARVTRLEALLRLGRRAQALATLEGWPEGSSLRGAELGLLKAELLAEAGRCREALPLFDAVMEGDPAFAERALFGRAGCRADLGEVVGSRADLVRYLDRFPRGRFADEARAALGL